MLETFESISNIEHRKLYPSLVDPAVVGYKVGVSTQYYADGRASESLKGLKKGLQKSS